MQTLTRHFNHAAFGLSGCAVGAAACAVAAHLTLGAVAASAQSDNEKTLTAPRTAAEWVIQSPPNTARPPYAFAAEDERLLDEVQRASFWYLWRCADPKTGMTYDRTSVKFASVAGVGFQLAAIPIAVEREWITREEGRERAERILKALESNPSNRKAGLFFHFLDGETAGPVDNDVVSTIDSALLFSGMLTASAYFGGKVREIGDRLVAEADWTFFVLNEPRADEPELKGYISLGWKPTSFKDPTGKGSLLPYVWADAADEQRLVAFLAAAAPKPEHRVDTVHYYRLRRPLGSYKDSGEFVYLPWSGALFTNFFAHCFIDYRSMGPDDPAKHGVERRPRVDWWENSRRAVAMHRTKVIENPKGFATFGPNAWGLTACDADGRYLVPGVYPTPVAVADAKPKIDVSPFVPKDDYGDGTIAPYGAGCAVMFEPKLALDALRHYRSLENEKGEPLLWRDPGKDGTNGGYGFKDSYNLDTGWIAPDNVAIDQGPLVLAIENARTARVWTWFHAHPLVAQACDRLGLAPSMNRLDQVPSPK